MQTAFRNVPHPGLEKRPKESSVKMFWSHTSFLNQAGWVNLRRQTSMVKVHALLLPQ